MSTAGPTSGNQRTTTSGGWVGEAPLLEKERKDPPKEATAKAREDPDGGRWVRRRHFVDRPGRDHVSLALEGAPPPLSRDLPYSLLSPWLTISPLVVVFRHFGFEPLSPLLSFRVVRALEKDAYIATLRALHFQKQSAADALVSALLSTFHPRRRR